MSEIKVPGNGSSSYEGGLGDHNDPRSLGLVREGQPGAILADPELTAEM